jgi:hypothetical protein
MNNCTSELFQVFLNATNIRLKIRSSQCQYAKAGQKEALINAEMQKNRGGNAATVAKK